MVEREREREFRVKAKFNKISFNKFLSFERKKEIKIITPFTKKKQKKKINETKNNIN